MFGLTCTRIYRRASLFRRSKYSLDGFLVAWRASLQSTFRKCSFRLLPHHHHPQRSFPGAFDEAITNCSLSNTFFAETNGLRRLEYLASPLLLNLCVLAGRILAAGSVVNLSVLSRCLGAAGSAVKSLKSLRPWRLCGKKIHPALAGRSQAWEARLQARKYWLNRTSYI
jgi:hypothetical protein